MRHYTEGIIFIPTQLLASRKALIERILAFIGGPQQILNQKVDLLYENVSGLSLVDTLERLSQSDEPGSFYIDLGGFTTDIWFEQPQQGYCWLVLMVNKYDFLEIEGDPARVESFAAAWVRFCEAMQASAAVFSKAVYDRTQWIEEHLAALLSRDMATFVTNVDWRTYLEPELGRLWREQEQEPHRYFIRAEELPSGALLIEAGEGSNPEMGDEDALYHVRFLIEHLTRHPEVSGSERLLKTLYQEEKRLLRINDDADYGKHRNNAYYDAEGARESRMILGEVRATWLCALERPGLVGVQQTFASEPGQAEVVVPIVAEEGREWIIATLRRPFDLNAVDWNDPQTGLQGRVQRMLAAARQHPVRGEPPRVVVFFWRGVSPEVRAELSAWGAGVEVADHLPVLQE
ncbi:MAG: hypothetical protein M3Z08_02820 [Chloroflexota bacterium]|nr:hypothetical protein [Chloroflexota bacterium]